MDRVLAQVSHRRGRSHGARLGFPLRSAMDRRRMGVRRKPARGARMSAIVEFSRVGYAVEREGGTVTVLRDFSLTISAGETLVLLGRSGSGKTTALKLVNRLLVPSSGEIFVE